MATRNVKHCRFGMLVHGGEFIFPCVACDVLSSRQCRSNATTYTKPHQNPKRNFPISCAASLQSTKKHATADTRTHGVQPGHRPFFTRAKSYQQILPVCTSNHRPDMLKRSNTWHSDNVRVASSQQYASPVLPTHLQKSHNTIPNCVVPSDTPRKSFYYRQRDTDLIAARQVLDSSVLHVKPPNTCAATGPVLRSRPTVQDRWKKTRVAGVLGRLWRYLYSKS